MFRVARPRSAPARIVAALFALILPCGLASAGIIELGRKGQLATGSSFSVIVEGNAFSDPNHVAGDTAQTILERIRAQIDATPQYIATTVTDFSDPNANTISVTLAPSGEPTSLEVSIVDGAIGGAYVSYSPSAGASCVVKAADAVAGNAGGTFEIDITLASGTVFGNVVSTPGKTVTTVNSDMIATLTGNGFTVSGATSGPWTITRGGLPLRKVEMKRTDTGITVSGVFLFGPPPSGGGGTATAAGIPTLSTWGLVLLVSLVALAGILRLKR